MFWNKQQPRTLGAAAASSLTLAGRGGGITCTQVNIHHCQADTTVCRERMVGNPDRHQWTTDKRIMERMVTPVMGQSPQNLKVNTFHMNFVFSHCTMNDCVVHQSANRGKVYIVIIINILFYTGRRTELIENGFIK